MAIFLPTGILIRYFIAKIISIKTVEENIKVRVKSPIAKPQRNYRPFTQNRAEYNKTGVGIRYRVRKWAIDELTISSPSSGSVEKLRKK